MGEMHNIKIPVLDIIQGEDCCGCSACSQVCPVNIIDMRRDKEGFLYPTIIKDNCINCNQCISVCPIVNSKKSDVDSHIYAGYSKDKNGVMSASSGGIFEKLAIKFLDTYEDSYVVGARWSEDCKHVFHEISNDKEHVLQFRTSKYIQSEKQDVFKSIKNLLDKNSNVMFVGTPCEVAGLKYYLKKEYDNLLLIDFLCKGPTSQSFMEDYVDAYNKKEKSNMTYVNMRYKWEKMDIWIPQFIKVRFSNGKEKMKEFYNSTIGHAFKIVQRPSCYNCRYYGFNKLSDITLGDYHGINKEYTFYNKYGVSLIFVNSPKGEKIFRNIKDLLFLCEVDKESVCKDNPYIERNNKKNSKRDEFISLFNEKNLKYAVGKTISFKDRVKMIIPWQIQRKFIKANRK